MSKLLRALSLLLLILITGGAHAGTGPYDNLRLVPNPVIAGQSVALIVRWSGCSPTGASSVSVSGSLITVRQIDNTDACWSAPPPPHDESYPLGRLAAGNYTVRFAADFTGIGGVVETVDLPLNVLGGQPAANVPLLSPPLLIALAFGLFILGGYGLRRRASAA